MSRFKLCTFPNGLRLLLVPSHEATSFQISVLVNTGSDLKIKVIMVFPIFWNIYALKALKRDLLILI